MRILITSGMTSTISVLNQEPAAPNSGYTYTSRDFMQTIEYKTINKSTWRRGEWDSEPDKRQWQDSETGLPCLIVRNEIGCLCGYVGVPYGHTYYEINENDVPVDVHGGLTFGGHCQGGEECKHICHKVSAGESDDVWWLGFDCSRWDDAIPSISLRSNYSSYRNIDYVIEEVTGLARQLAGL